MRLTVTTAIPILVISANSAAVQTPQIIRMVGLGLLVSIAGMVKRTAAKPAMELQVLVVIAINKEVHNANIVVEINIHVMMFMHILVTVLVQIIKLQVPMLPLLS